MFRRRIPSAGTRSSGSAELARLLLRGAVGSTMIAHGVNHGRTLPGTSGWFESIGFRNPRLQARLSSAVEIGSGAALIAGLGTPLSGSAVVGTMSVAIATVHRENGYFIVKEGWEYTGFISVATIALSALGSGRLSADRLLGVDEVGSPGGRALTTLALGLAGAAGQLALFWRKPS